MISAALFWSISAEGPLGTAIAVSGDCRLDAIGVAALTGGSPARELRLAFRKCRLFLLRAMGTDGSTGAFNAPSAPAKAGARTLTWPSTTGDLSARSRRAGHPALSEWTANLPAWTCSMSGPTSGCSGRRARRTDKPAQFNILWRNSLPWAGGGSVPSALVWLPDWLSTAFLELRL